MYSNRDAAVPVVPVAPARAQGGLASLPILALCCLLFLLLLIAATIVLALIPIYTQSKDVTRGGTSGNYYGRAPVDGSVPDGSVSDSTRASIGSTLGTKLAGNSQATTVKSGIVSSNSRRKRGLLQRSQRANTKFLFIIFVFNFFYCFRTPCSIRQTTNVDIGTITLILFGQSYPVSLIFTIFPLGSVITAGPTVATTTVTTASVTTGPPQG